MDFKVYQEKAITTKIYDPSLAIPYCVLGITGEAGEVAEKVKKYLRDEFDNYSQGIMREEMKVELSKEIGDVLWYLAALSDELGLQLEDIAQQNIIKLQSRKDRNFLSGSGDNR
jgi:NTP pyrophosphatase (non-canonical NTP hydrolase)